MSAETMPSSASPQAASLPSPSAESQLSSPALGSAAAFDYRDDETKAKFAAMMAGAGKKGRKSGEKKTRAQPTASTAAASPSLPSSSSFSPSSPTAVAPLLASASFSPAVSVDPSLPETGVMGAESPSGRSKRRQRTPKAAEQEASADAAPSSSFSSSAAPSLTSSSSVTASAMAALARASPARSGRPPTAVADKPKGRAASALAALSSRLKNTMSTGMPQSAASAITGKEDAVSPQLTNGNGGYAAAGPHSLLDPSPSSLASAFFSPAPSTPASPRQRAAAAAWKGRKEEVEDDAAEDEDDSPVALSAPRDGDEDDEEEDIEAEEEAEEEEEEETPTAAERVEHFEPSDAVKGVIRREQLDAMEQDSKLQLTMPWHQQQQQQDTASSSSSSSSSGGSTGNGRRAQKTKERKSSSRLSPTSPSTPSSSASPKAAQLSAQGGGDRVSPAPQYGSLVPSPEAPSTPNEEGDSPLTVANDYDHHYSLPPSAAPIASATAASAATSATQSAAVASPPPQHPSSPPPHPHHPYLPFTPSPSYFSTPMLPDLTSHGQHIKLILYAIRRQKRRTLLPLQSHQCPQCGLQLRNRIFSRPRYCAYTGLYYCRQCHVKERAVVPGRVLWYGDVRRYKVCRLAFQYLESIVGVPVLPMSAINPSLYRASKRLRYAFLLRQQLVYLRPFIETCAHRDELLVLFGDRVYMLNDTPVLSTSSRGLQTSFLDIVSSSEQAAAEPAQDPSHSARDMYSMRDLLEIVRGQLTEKLSLLVSTLISHVVHSECEDCGSKGAHCEGDGCDDRVPIYSFQVGSVIGCENCGCLFHRRCWNGDGVCPHCRRCADVQDSVVAAHRVAHQVREGMADSRGAAWAQTDSVAADTGSGRRGYDDDSVVQY